MTFKMKRTQTITIFTKCVQSKRFIGAGDAYIRHTLDYRQIYGYCAQDINDHIAIFDETGTWSLHEDHRGETVYDATTGNQVYIPLPAAMT